VMLDHQTTSCSLICIYIAVTASKKYIVQPPSIVTQFVNSTLFIQTENRRKVNIDASFVVAVG
jgi:hypothetical protein